MRQVTLVPVEDTPANTVTLVPLESDIAQHVLAPAGGLTVPQGFTAGVAADQNLDKPDPQRSFAEKAINAVAPVPQMVGAGVGKFGGTAVRYAGDAIAAGGNVIRKGLDMQPAGENILQRAGKAIEGHYETATKQLLNAYPLNEDEYVSEGIRSGLVSTGDMLATLPLAWGRALKLINGGMDVSQAAMKAAPTVITALSAKTGAASYSKYADRGHSFSASTVGAFTDAAIEKKTEDMENLPFFEYLTNPQKVGLKSLAFAMGKLGLVGQFTEQLATLGQDMTDKVMGAPGMTAEQKYKTIVDHFNKEGKDGLTDFARNARQTAISTLTMHAAMGGIGGVGKMLAGQPTDDAGSSVSPQQAAAGTGQTAAHGGEQGGGQSVAAAPAAAESSTVPGSQAEYEAMLAAQEAAQQEDDIPQFTPPPAPPQQAADLPGAETVTAPSVVAGPAPAEVGTLTKAAQVLNPYQQMVNQPYAQAPDQPVMPVMPEVRGAGAGLNILQAPGEQEQAVAWMQQKLADPATSKFERDALVGMSKSPGQVELIRYWRGFQNRTRQPRFTPAQGGLTSPAPTVARDSAPPVTVPVVPEPAAVAPPSAAVAGEGQDAVIAKVDAKITNLLNLIKKGRKTPQEAFDLLYAMPEYKQLSTEAVQVGDVQFGVDGDAEDRIFAAFEQAAKEQGQGAGGKGQDTRRQVDPAKDDLITAIGKLGGLNTAQVEQQWGKTIADTVVSLRDYASKQGAGYLHPINSKGRPLDEIRESLEQHGYLQPGADLNDLLEKINRQLAGKTQYSNQNQQQVADQDLSAPPEGYEDYPFSLEGINFPKKNKNHVEFLKRKLAEAKHPNDKRRYRKTLRAYLEKIKSEQAASAPSEAALPETTLQPAKQTLQALYAAQDAEIKAIDDHYATEEQRLSKLKGEAKRKRNSKRSAAIDAEYAELKEKTAQQRTAVYDKYRDQIVAHPEYIAQKTADAAKVKQMQAESQAQQQQSQSAQDQADLQSVMSIGGFEAARDIFRKQIKDAQSSINKGAKGYTLAQAESNIKAGQDRLKWLDELESRTQASGPVSETTPATTLAPDAKTAESEAQNTPPTATRNSKGNIELKFAARPDDGTIEQLTAAGFKFNQRQKVWYAGDTAEAVKLAEELSGGKLPAATPKKKTGLRNMLAKIKEAGGIKPQSLIDALDKNEVNHQRWIRVKSKTGVGVDQMAIRMHTAGWPVPVDVDGNPDTNAFAQLLKGAVNGKPVVHPDNADKAVAVQLAAELDQISQLTDEDYELQSLLDQEHNEAQFSSLDDVEADLFDLLSAEDYDAVVAGLRSFRDEVKAVIEEIEYGKPQTGADQPDNQNGQRNVNEDTTGETGGGGTVPVSTDGKGAETSGSQTNVEVTPLSEVSLDQVAPDMDADRTAADPRTSLPSLDDFSKLFDEMAAPAAKQLSPREQGAAAFAADAKRLAPADLDAAGKIAWYQGYDKASLDAPLPEEKTRTEVVSKSGEQQVKLFATPPAFGKKPQTKGKAVDTSALLDAFTDESTVQPDMFSAPAPKSGPSVEDSKAAIRAILAAAKKPVDDGTVKEEQEQYGDETYQLLRPHILNLWKNAYDGGDLAQVVPTFIRSLLADFGADIKPHAETFYKEILNGDILVSGGDTNVNHQPGGADLERDSELRPADEVGQGAVQPGGFGAVAGSLRQGSSSTEAPTGTADGTAGVSGREAAAAGTGRDSTVQGTVVGVDGQRPAGSELNQRSSDFDDRGASFDPVAASAVSQAAEERLTASEREERQRLAQKIPVVPGDLDNIVASLPVLFPGQTDDVKFAEDRFAKPDGTGVLFTNGTGTGKTFSGLGIIKRFERQGKKNILIVASNAEVINGWVLSGRKLLLDISRLEDTKDAGNGIVVTTFANFGANAALAKRNWDLVVVDEAQYLNSSKDGGDTKAINALRAITLHPDGGWQRAQMLHDKLYANYQAAFAKNSTATEAHKRELAEKWNQAQKAIQAEVAATAPADRTRVVFLSATPFAYHKNIDYANKYLFDYDEGQPKDETSRGYNSGSNYERFLMTHFGYRMRTGKLTEPPPEVDRGLMERQFNSWLKKRGVLSSRMLAVEHDYDRKFVLAESAIGRKIDEGLDLLRDREEYRPLADYVTRRFDYLHRRYLLEAIKAKEVIPILKQHVAMGRKVVVFHDYNQGGGMNPFDLRGLIGNGEEVRVGDRMAKLGDLAKQFVAERPDLVELPFKSYGSALATLKAAFPGILTVNGTNSKKVNREAIERFQTDNNGDNLIVVQADKGKEGISLHDTTGVHPRVLINLGLPGKPTMAIQQEGRIYRTGQASNAMFRYMNTGTNWERYAFATTLARRASTAENLAMGEEARMLLDAYIEAYRDSDTWAPGHEGEGTGGKERDRAANSALTEWDRAVSFYFSQRKGRQNDIGKDYFATPEPLGLKMVEWADVLPGETVLEPSGGHGAIARWFPDLAKRRAIEPSFELASKLALVFDGDIVQGTFEDHHTINKYDAIVMNPPFGSGGKTAIDHLDKAAQHLKDNGRIVALIPTGPAADKKFEKWLYDEKVEKVEPLYTDAKLGDIYRGDTITIEGFGTAHTVVVGSIVNTGSARFVRPKGADPSQAINLIAANKIEPTGPREKRISNPLNLTAEITLPSVTFERAGTSVATRIVVLDKGGDKSFSRRDYSRAENIKDFFERIKDSDIPGRKHNSQPNNEVEPVKAADVQPDGGIVPAAQQSDDFTLASFKHTQTGETMYVATLNKRDAALYSRALSLVKKNKGYYSKYTKNGAIAGFLFKDEADRSRFLQAMGGDTVNEQSIEYRPGTTEEWKAKGAELVKSTTLPAVTASGANRRLGRVGRGILASKISTELRKNGIFNFVGQTITDPVDLAAIAQVYRNPQYETLRYYFLKNNRIVGQLGVSSRLPGVSKAFPVALEQGSDWLQQQMVAFGADAYYLLHNHPNGNVTASDTDMEITRRFAKEVPGFAGHIIINHNKYLAILPEHVQQGASRPQPIEKTFSAGPDTIRVPGKPSPFLGRVISQDSDLVQLGKEIEIQSGHILLVVQGGKGDGIIGLAEMPVSERPERMAAYIKRLGLRTGGKQIFAVLPDASEKSIPADRLAALRKWAVRAVEQGYLRDALIEGKGVDASIVPGQRLDVYFGKELAGRMVSQSAWHGSPHDHDKFSTDKIGTGEGAQAYGWGLYFASSRDVAEHYRNALSKIRGNPKIKDRVLAGRIGMQFMADGKQAVLDSIKSPFGWNGQGEYWLSNEDKDAIKAWMDEPLNKGRLYKVELAPAEDEYLLWDKPLSEQSEKVKAALKDDRLYKMLNSGKKQTGGGFYGVLTGYFAQNKTGNTDTAQKPASEYLHSLGIRGIKYLDGTSRGKGDGNYNYVIFNDADVEITAKFSLNDAAESFTGLQADAIRKVLPWAEVVQAADQVPEKVLADAARMGVKPWNIEGFLHDGKVWLVAENIRTLSRARQLALGHELAHLGQDERLIDLAVDWFKSTADAQDNAFKQAAHQLLQEEADKRKLDLGKPDQYRTAVTEATARLAEDMAVKGVKPGVIQKIVNHLRVLLRKSGIRLKVTDKELAGAVAEMLRLGEKRLSGMGKGGMLEQNTVEVEFEKSKAMLSDAADLERDFEERNQRSIKVEIVQGDEREQSLAPLARAFGKRVVFFRTEDRMGRVLQGTVLDKERIFINADTPINVWNVFGHELLHSMAWDQPFLYKQLLADVYDTIQSFDTFRDELNAINRKLGRDEDTVSESYEELLAHFLGDHFTDKAMWDRVMQKQPTIFGRIMATIERLLNSVVNYTTDSDPFFKDIDKAKRAFADVLADYAENKEYLAAARAEKEASRNNTSQFSLRSRVTEAAQNIPWDEVLPAIRKTWTETFLNKKTANPLDWSRTWRLIEEEFPGLADAMEYLMGIPSFQAERDPSKSPFYEAGLNREEIKTQIMMDILGYTPGEKDSRSIKDKIKDFVTKWDTGISHTEWEKLNQRKFAMTKQQRAGLDLLVTIGDSRGNEYESLRTARMNPRLNPDHKDCQNKAAARAIDATVFAF